MSKTNKSCSGFSWHLIDQLNWIKLSTLKVSVNENLSTLLNFVFFWGGGDFWHEWVLDFILAQKDNQKVLFDPYKICLFCFSL